jgi:putative Ca2+/H+ antiporter (TMEM165/GDT1 family)
MLLGVLTSLLLSSGEAASLTNYFSTFHEFFYGFSRSLLLVFLSELGDKTFVSTLVLSTQALSFRQAMVILLATNLAAGSLAIISALLFNYTVSLLDFPQSYITLASATCCTVCGVHILIQAWKNDGKNNEPEGKQQQSTPVAKNLFTLFFSTFFLSLLSELGDRSQLSMIMLSGENGANLVAIVTGGILGHIGCSCIAIIAGEFIAKFIQPHNMQIAAGLSFIIIAITQAKQYQENMAALEPIVPK